MNAGLIPVRYATALYEYAESDKIRQQIFQEAKVLSKYFSDFPRLGNVIDNPVIAQADKRSLVLTALGNCISTPFERFLDLLFQNHRESFLYEIVLKYVDLYQKHHNVYLGKLTTAKAINLAMENKLIHLLEKSTGGSVEVEKIVDPEIIGGFVLEVDHVRWDASVSGQLQRVRNEYIERNKKTV